MADGIDSLNNMITLKIKAPNQEYDDQSVECVINWSIKEVKDHLSSIYPGQPKVEEQKLIYMGQVCKDSLVLKDILRTFEGEENRLFHLVINKIKRKNVADRDVNNAPVRGVSNDNQESVTTQNVATPMEAVARILNYERVTAYLRMQEHYVNFLRYYAEYDEMYGSNTVREDLRRMLRRYNPRASDALGFQQREENTSWLGIRIEIGGGGGQGDIQATAVLGTGNGNEEVAHDGVNHDWLDFVYNTSRVAIFMAIVYYYSTPGRLMLVAFLAIIFIWRNIRIVRMTHGNGINGVVNLFNNLETEAPVAATATATAPEAGDTAVIDNNSNNQANANNNNNNNDNNANNNNNNNNINNGAQRVNTLSMMRAFVSSFIPDH